MTKSTASSIATATVNGGVKSPSRKKIRPLKKAPQAPKRFKSSYILFFVHVQQRIKQSLPVGQASAPEVSKRASELWKALSPEDRLHWDNEAVKEKQRYLAEKKVYTGPWQIPHKRAKKDPTAPKRNPSAFLLFSLTKRKDLKNENPGLKNTEISRILGELWRQTADEEKRPFVEREQVERQKYKENMSAWKEKKARETAEKKRKEEAEKVNVDVQVQAHVGTVMSVSTASASDSMPMSMPISVVKTDEERSSAPSMSPPLPTSGEGEELLTPVSRTVQVQPIPVQEPQVQLQVHSQPQAHVQDQPQSHGRNDVNVFAYHHHQYRQETSPPPQHQHPGSYMNMNVDNYQYHNRQTESWPTPTSDSHYQQQQQQHNQHHHQMANLRYNNESPSTSTLMYSHSQQMTNNVPDKYNSFDAVFQSQGHQQQPPMQQQMQMQQPISMCNSGFSSSEHSIGNPFYDQGGNCSNHLTTNNNLLHHQQSPQPHQHQGSVKLEDGERSSPYSYTEGFDPVPIH